MTTRFVLAGLLTLLTASFAVGKPVLHGTVNEQGNAPPATDNAKSTSTSLSRGEIKAPAKPETKPESKEIELAWDAWHKRLAQAIYYRFDILALQKFKDSPPLGVKIRYLVTKDGRIEGLKIVEKSSDMMFDALACTAIMWQGRKPLLLKFPEGSNRQSVEKFATFTQNMGDEGIETTQGDKETVRVDQ